MQYKEAKNNRKLKKIALFLSAVFCVVPMTAKTNKSKRNGTAKQEPELTIKYDKNHAINDDWGVYEITGSDGQVLMLTQKNLEGYQLTAEENKLHEEIFSKECTITYKKLSWDEALDLVKTAKYSLATYEVGKNIITVNQSAETRESILQRLDLARQNGDSEQMMTCAYMLVLRGIEENPERLRAILAHEETHQESDAKGINKLSTISGKQSAKLDMLNEIKATMAQVKVSYNKYLKTGNIDDIDGVNAGDLTSFKKWLMSNPDKAGTQECKLKLAEAIFWGFLEENNVKGQYYYYQVMKKTHAIGRQAGAVVDNELNTKEYYRRVDIMFKDTALGDVRSVINPDFKLGAGTLTETKTEALNGMSKAEEFIFLLTDNASTVEEATERVKKVLDIVRIADEDGIRTEREQKRIDRRIASVLYSRAKTI